MRDLSVDFDGDAGLVHAVRSVSFDLMPGRTFAVVGESGSGKSVTAQAILGILSKRARITGGSIVFRDPLGGAPVDIARLDPNGEAMRAIRGGRIAMIFQEPMTSLSPVHTVGDQVTEALRLHAKVSRREAEERAVKLFGHVGFHKPKRMLTTYPFELSGGMRQRAMIAMALICKPALLIADEPTTALDVTTQAQILALIRDVQAEKGTAVMLITHDLGVVANMADDVLVMYRGEVMERGRRDDIFLRPQHPYLKALIRAVPHFDMPQAERLTPLREIKVSGIEMYSAGCETAGPAKGRPVLEIAGVSKVFTMRAGLWSGRRETITALSRASLSIKAGATVGLVGESGSGKTTLARIVMRAVKPDEGHVRFDDGSGPRDVFALDAEALKAYRRTVQFVFQDPFSSLNPRMTVYDILSEPLIIHGIGDADRRHQRVKALLDLVGLDPRYLRRYPHSFSGGERQRIGLARALALSPSVILCDEPTSALDVSVQAQILNLLKDLQKALGISLLFVSHNLAVVDYMASEIAVMCRGHIVEQAPRDLLFRAPQHPYTKALLAAIPEPDINRPLDFAVIRDAAYSDPARWPEPYTIHPEGPPPAMVEVVPGHWVRVGEAVAAEPRRMAIA
ncbi:ABC transporter ATP-binding protein [Labrys wisconsinensis]|uniref:Peptide/nickel transport system ATP-binding protein n=1 Tax=Labrys wisconsinensis TaxID=425677 RepID=A0ABU0IYF4_9HYPH|nr:ABC transporter ATP-binding protein [Labrys wisconsinensis]MDQ0467047.1 peptide/nickel transport system ATP-binding protein [Labrys wisconsinensis]